MSLAVNIRHVRGVAVFDLSGRLVAGLEGHTVCERLRQASEKGDRLILLNCEGLTHVDSCGIGDLVAAYAAIVRRGGVVKLLSPTAQLRHVLAITHLDSLFEIEDDELIALSSFTSGANARSQRKLKEYTDSGDQDDSE